MAEIILFYEFLVHHHVDLLFLRMRDDVVKAKGISGKYLASFSTEFVNPHNF